MARVTIFVMALILSLALAACTGTAPPATTTDGEQAPAPASAGLEAVKLGVGFIPSVQFAPLYAGIDQGFFAAEGIDLTLEYGYENDYLKLVGVGDLPFIRDRERRPGGVGSRPGTARALRGELVHPFSGHCLLQGRGRHPRAG